MSSNVTDSSDRSIGLSLESLGGRLHPMLRLSNTTTTKRRMDDDHGDTCHEQLERWIRAPWNFFELADLSDLQPENFPEDTNPLFPQH